MAQVQENRSPCRERLPYRPVSPRALRCSVGQLSGRKPRQPEDPVDFLDEEVCFWPGGACGALPDHRYGSQCERLLSRLGRTSQSTTSLPSVLKAEVLSPAAASPPMGIRTLFNSDSQHRLSSKSLMQSANIGAFTAAGTSFEASLSMPRRLPMRRLSMPSAPAAHVQSSASRRQTWSDSEGSNFTFPTQVPSSAGRIEGLCSVDTDFTCSSNLSGGLSRHSSVETFWTDFTMGRTLSRSRKDALRSSTIAELRCVSPVNTHRIFSSTVCDEKQMTSDPPLKSAPRPRSARGTAQHRAELLQQSETELRNAPKLKIGREWQGSLCQTKKQEDSRLLQARSRGGSSSITPRTASRMTMEELTAVVTALSSHMTASQRDLHQAVPRGPGTGETEAFAEVLWMPEAACSSSHSSLVSTQCTGTFEGMSDEGSEMLVRLSQMVAANTNTPSNDVLNRLCQHVTEDLRRTRT